MPFKKPAGGDRYRSFCGEFRFLSTDDAFNFHVEIWLLNDLVNRNNWKYINLEQHRALFAGTPILIAYTNGGKGIGDLHDSPFSHAVAEDIRLCIQKQGAAETV